MTGVRLRMTRYNRGTAAIAGWNTQRVGYRMECTCGWSKRHNGNLRESEPFARDHLREAHGLRGQAATDVIIR